MNRGEQEVYRVRTHSVMEHTEQHRLEQLEHSRVQEEQAGRSHREHVVLDPWFLWHTQQEAGAAATPTQEKPHGPSSLIFSKFQKASKSVTMLTSAGTALKVTYFITGPLSFWGLFFINALLFLILFFTEEYYAWSYNRLLTFIRWGHFLFSVWLNKSNIKQHEKLLQTKGGTSRAHLKSVVAPAQLIAFASLSPSLALQEVPLWASHRDIYGCEWKGQHPPITTLVSVLITFQCVEPNDFKGSL